MGKPNHIHNKHMNQSTPKRNLKQLQKTNTDTTNSSHQNKHTDHIPGLITQNIQTYEKIETKTEKREKD